MINRLTLLAMFVLGIIASNVMSTPVPFVAFFATLLFALPALYALYKTTNTKTTIIAFISLALFALIVEEIAVATGVPYSGFTYSNLLGTTLIAVPLATPLSFFALAIGAWAYAANSTLHPGYNKKKHVQTWSVKQRFILGAATAVILVIADLIIDPAATALGLWIWASPGVYYGIPAINFVGWALIGFLAGVKLTFIVPKPNITLTHSLQLIIAYWVGVNAGLGLMIPAAIGAIISVLAYHRYRHLKGQ